MSSNRKVFHFQGGWVWTCCSSGTNYYLNNLKVKENNNQSSGPSVLTVNFSEQRCDWLCIHGRKELRSVCIEGEFSERLCDWLCGGRSVSVEAEFFRTTLRLGAMRPRGKMWVGEGNICLFGAWGLMFICHYYLAKVRCLGFLTFWQRISILE